MNLNNKTVVVTGGAQGIGKALAVAFAKAGAKVVVADKLAAKAQLTAAEIGGLGMGCDVSNEAEIQNLISTAEQENGPIDLFCSNAGISAGDVDHAASASNEAWQACWDIHVMAHVYAARAVLPSMIERGEGYFVQMASAAGLLSQIGDAPYSASKHAAIGFAESLSISHGDDGIKVSVVCPQYVATPMLGYSKDETGGDSGGDSGSEGRAAEIDQAPGVISPEQVAQAVLQGISEEVFLILPHPQVEQYFQAKSANYDRWLGGMRKLRRNIIKKINSTRLAEMHKLV